ncbi:MAG: RNB domain-containing ribonuclease, partial [Bacilli bacterium]
MKEKVLDILNDESVKINFCGLKKKLGITRKHLDDELRCVLEKLELDGLVYCCDDFYQKFPSNFFVATVQVSKKGNRFILYNGMAKYCKEQNLDGVLNYDTVVFKKENKDIIAVKVLARKMPNVVCDVKVNDDGVKYLSVYNSKNHIPLVIDHNSMKKLVEGERIVVSLSVDLLDNVYIATFVERIGNKNDLDSELTALAYNNGFVTKYPDAVLKELELIPDEVKSDELKGRLDKRNDNVFTIDGKGAKDLDDAISIKVLPNKNFQLTVSIANVSHYIKYGSALWNFAEENTTSVYLINSVVSMFHAKISNGICSLNPLVDRLARSFVIEIDNQGKVVDYKMINSVINSKKKMNYDDV